MARRPIRISGFTLVELAMVLFIVSLLLGGMLGPLSARLEGEERRQTLTALNDIRDSLIGFAMINGHLPCPDCADGDASCGSAAVTIDDGIEDGVDAGAGVSPRAGNTYDQCATQEGFLPWATLGVSGNDAWSQRFRYRVDETFADDIAGTGVATCASRAGISFQICSTGNIQIVDAAAASVAQNLPFVVWSVGKNATEAGNPVSAVEQENQDDDVTFVDTDFSNVTATEFDDLLIWTPSNTLIYRMIQAERLP